MSERFDPYRKWLGIPVEEQPPHHYRLLGLGLFETDPDVIQEAADRQMAHVQTHKAGKYSDLSQKLLNQLASAKLCLLNEQKKAAYDKQLKAKLVAAKKTRQQAVSEAVALTPDGSATRKAKPTPKARPQSAAGAPMIQVDEASMSPTSRARKRGMQTWQLAAIGGGFVAVCLVIGFLMVGGDDPTPVAVKTDTNQDQDDQKPPVDLDTPEPEPAPVTPEPVTPVTPPPVEPVRPSPPPPVNPKLAPPDADPPQVEPVDPPKSDPPKSEPKPEPEPEQADDAIILKSRSFGGRFDLSDLVAQAEAAEAAETGQPVTEEFVEIKEMAKKMAVPEQAKVDENLQLIRDVFKSEFENAKTPLEKSNLAKFLLKQAAETEGDSSRYALLVEARDVAMDAGSATGAMKMVDSLSKLFEVDSLSMKASTLSKGAEVAKTASQYRSVAANSLALVETAVVDGKYSLARQLVELGLGAARKARDGNLVKLASSLNDELGSLQQQFEAANAALATLQDTPEDPAANLAVGKYQCLVTGDWEGGLPQLAKGSDAKLKAAAELDLTSPTEAAAQAKVGDAWWDLAEAADEYDKAALFDRSGHWYRQAVNNLGGLTKAKIDSRLKKLAESAVSGTGVTEPAVDSDNPLNEKAVGRYEVVATNRRAKDREVSIWELKENHQALKDGEVVARWEVDGNRVKITFLDDVQGFVYIKYNRYVPAGGQHTLASGNETWKWDVTLLKVVAVWEHSARRTEQLTFYSNGKINDPTGSDTWALRGNELSINFADRPRDSVTVRLAPGGKTYSGRVGSGFGFGFFRVEGKLLQGPETP